MLPWIIAESRLASNANEAIVLRVKGESIVAVSRETQQVMFTHSVVDVVRCCRCRPPDSSCFAYLLRPSVGGSRATNRPYSMTQLVCHVFMADDAADVGELFATIKAMASCCRRASHSAYERSLSSISESAYVSHVRTPSSAAILSEAIESAANGDDVQPIDNFEVLFAGRLELPDERPYEAFIDDAIDGLIRYNTTTMRAVRIRRNSAEVDEIGARSNCDCVNDEENVFDEEQTEDRISGDGIVNLTLSRQVVYSMFSYFFLMHYIISSTVEHADVAGNQLELYQRSVTRNQAHLAV